MVTMTCPGKVMVTVPPQVHMHVESSLRAGMSVIMTHADPGTHGSTMTGIHGIGVKTPRAAEVAEATSGLASDEHIPNVGMLSMGAKSMIVATGIDEAMTMCGVGLRTAGATPKSHIIVAPSVTMLIG
jgi:hypothetical protein